ncbi:MAG: hypothetical protein MZU95_00840 [Desulfomicrobium escambiense]|nr:hypothetical protein [Desulfomicrobium escambiense]
MMSATEHLIQCGDRAGTGRSPLDVIYIASARWAVNSRLAGAWRRRMIDTFR